ncbi:hypothetical protein K440DRAFT_613830 [Wilcoxina mikolae CBS 423.85]|nr:hypothetical protein K440DRAFT_613830 [Wilcoxina mikolae CBS 423.85]
MTASYYSRQNYRYMYILPKSEGFLRSSIPPLLHSFPPSLLLLLLLIFLLLLLLFLTPT